MLEKNKEIFVPGELLSVIWLDAISEDSWVGRSDLEEHLPTQIHSVGHLVNLTDDKITLSLNHDIENDNFSCSITVPFAMIVSIRKLKVEKS